MTISDEVIEQAVTRYGRERDRYLKLAARIADIATSEIVEKNTIRAQVTSRTKSIRSFEGKLRRFSKSGKKTYATVAEVFEDIGDFSGVRIATYRPEDQELVKEEVMKVFRGPNEGPALIDTKDNIDFKEARFYKAIHCQVCLHPDGLVGDDENLIGTSCEIQICSMMAHVWNEIEHDIAYKPEGTGPEKIERGLLESLGHLTCSGDAIITRLLEATEARLQQQTGDFVDVHDFVARLRGEFPSIELSVNGGLAFEIVKLLGLAHPGRVLAAAAPLQTDLPAVQDRLKAFNDYLQNLGSSDLHLNARSADVLSVALLDRNAPVVMNALDRRSTGRPSRAAGLARRFGDFLATEADNQAAGAKEGSS